MYPYIGPKQAIKVCTLHYHAWKSTCLNFVHTICTM